jgi:hypothetical protein
LAERLAEFGTAPHVGRRPPRRTPGVAIIAALAVLGALMFIGVREAPLEELAERDVNASTDAAPVEDTTIRTST